jgi:hypothetical protein
MAADPVFEFLNSGKISNSEPTVMPTESSSDPVYNFLATAKVPQDTPVAKSESGIQPIEDTTLGRLHAGVIGETKGAYDMMIRGPGQLITNAVSDIYPKDLPGYETVQKAKKGFDEFHQESDKRYADLTKNVGTSASIGEVAGDIVGGIAGTGKIAANGAGLLDRMIAAGKSGAVVGAMTPVKDESNYWVDKAKQIGTSAIISTIAQPGMEGVGKALGSGAQGITDLGKKVISFFKGEASDPNIQEVIKNASPELQQAIASKIKQGYTLNDKMDAALGRQLQADSLPIKIRLTGGQATQDSGQFSNELNTRSLNPALRDHLQQQNQSLIENLNHVRDTGAPEASITDHITAGENLIKSGQNLIDSRAQQTTEAYKKLSEANGGNLPMDGKAFVVSADEALKKNFKGYFVPKEVRSIMDEVKEGGMTFERFENLRTILSAESRSNTNGNVVGAVNTIRNSLENMPVSSEVKGVKELADFARKSAKSGFDLLDEVPALKAIESGKALDHNFVQKYIIGSSKKDLTSFAESLKEDPIALQTIKAGTVNYLKSVSGVGGDSGNFSQSGYNKALQALGPKLDIIFNAEEAGVLRNVGAVSKYISLAPKGAYVNSSNTDVANLLRAGAEHIVDRATGLPIMGVGRKVVEAATASKNEKTQLADMLGPGAGVGTPGSKYLLNKFPKQFAKGAGIPISEFTAQQQK